MGVALDVCESLMESGSKMDDSIKKDRYWINRVKELRKQTTFAKPEHYKLGAKECYRRANWLSDYRFNKIKYDDVIELDIGGKVEKHENYTDETWNKIYLFEYAEEYWRSIAYEVDRKEQRETPMHIHFEHKDIIITDPCYIFSNWDKFLNTHGTYEESENMLLRDTIYGDWSCTTFDDRGGVIGRFCADAGMVCVYPLDEPLLDQKSVEEFKKKDWCATIIKDFTGDVSFVRHAGEEDEFGNNDWLTVEGRGSVNFSGRQTGL